MYKEPQQWESQSCRGSGPEEQVVIYWDNLRIIVSWSAAWERCQQGGFSRRLSVPRAVRSNLTLCHAERCSSWINRISKNQRWRWGAGVRSSKVCCKHVRAGSTRSQELSEVVSSTLRMKSTGSYFARGRTNTRLRLWSNNETAWVHRTMNISSVWEVNLEIKPKIIK